MGNAAPIEWTALDHSHHYEMSTQNSKSIQPMPVVIAAVLSLVFCLLSLMAAVQKSPTYDEPVHLFAGYSYLKWHDFRVNPEHPPLAKALAAIPLLFLDVDAAGVSRAERDIVQQRKEYGWELAHRFFKSNDTDRLFFYSKLVMISLAAMLGIFVFLWGRAVFGLAAGGAALMLYSFDPNIIAHSSIVHTDVPFALCFFAGTYFFWRTWKQFTWANLLCTALFFALSVITKFSFFVILPIWAILGTIRAFSSEPQQSQVTSPSVVDRPWSKLVLLAIVLATSVIIAYVGIWSAYGFRFDAVSYERGQMPVGRLLSKGSWLNPLVSVNSKYFLLPEAWVYGLADAFKALDRSSYLLGEISNEGFGLYFPIAFAVKTPLPTLLLLLVALGVVMARRRLRNDEIFLLVPVLVLFTVAVWSRFNIGLRHILPIYPFLFVWLGGAVQTIWASENQAARFATLLVGIWLLVSSVKTFPNYLAFFNELAGGPTNGHKVLVDSNLDWGQDLKGLKRWMDKNELKKIEFAYFGTMDPSYYGIDAIPATGSITVFWRGGKASSAASPYIAISATYLAGLYLAQRDTYALFRGKTPIASIGHSIVIYRKDQ
jgi:Dolichyl-phosphate-mannose-protein mannosyltransferase